MEDVIKVEHLKKSYGTNIAVNDLSFNVKKGSVFGLLGSNGAGKSTTIECILGTKKKDHGNIFLLGFKPETRDKRLFEHIGVQFQEANYQENIKVFELCEVTSSLYKNPKDITYLLNQCDLLNKKNSFVKDLSGGQKQRLFIVLALIPNPQVVFLDELTTGLDARARRDVWKMLEDLKKKGLTILLTSHFMDEVEVLCDEILILKKGNKIYQGTVLEAIKESKQKKFEDAYLWFTDEKEIQNECL